MLGTQISLKLSVLLLLLATAVLQVVRITAYVYRVCVVVSCIIKHFDNIKVATLYEEFMSVNCFYILLKAIVTYYH